MSVTMWGEAVTPWMAEMARDILGLLDTVYPGHPWKVHVYGDDTGGGFHIRHLEFEGHPFGMNQPRAHLYGSASEMRADVIRMGGELLERVNLARGKRNEADRVTTMEGVPERFQPAQEKKPIDIDAVIEKALRDAPRPQVERELNNGN